MIKYTILLTSCFVLLLTPEVEARVQLTCPKLTCSPTHTGDTECKGRIPNTPTKIKLNSATMPLPPIAGHITPKTMHLKPSEVSTQSFLNCIYEFNDIPFMLSFSLNNYSDCQMEPAPPNDPTQCNAPNSQCKVICKEISTTTSITLVNN